MVSTVLCPGCCMHTWLGPKIKRDLSFQFCFIETANRHVTILAMAGIPAGATQDADNFCLIVHYAVIVTLTR